MFTKKINSCLLAYGETGSGKTHTMLGSCTLKRIMEWQRNCSKIDWKNFWENVIGKKIGYENKLHWNL